MAEFFDNSVKAKEVKVGPIGRSKYFWAEVPIGKSFAVPRENIKFGVLRSLASKSGKKLGKKFRVIDHGEGPYEVACLPQSTEEAVATSSTLFEALDKIKGNGE